MTDAQRAGKGMGDATLPQRALDAIVKHGGWQGVLDALATAGTLAALQKEAETNRQWAESAQATVATLAAKLRAGEEYHLAAVEYIEAYQGFIDAEDEYGESSNKYEMRVARGRCHRAVKAYRAALAAYKQAGMGGES